ncbi:hypothetical protein ACRRTK_021094 [Alexandromys fortis]
MGQAKKSAYSLKGKDQLDEVLSEDSTLTCMQHYEEVQTSASDLLDSQDSTGKPKSHQSRELPRIPPENAVDAMLTARVVEGDSGPGMEGPYEVLKDSSSQENMVEDCLYETVKEIKEVADKGQAGKSKSTSALKELQGVPAEGKPDFAEYASVDRNKKCRQSVNAESILGASSDPEEEAPPPVPVKLLDENANLPEKGEAKAEEQAPEGTSGHNKVQPVAKALQGPPSFLPHTSISGVPLMSPPTEALISAMYSSVNKLGQSAHKPGPSPKEPELTCQSVQGPPQRSSSSCNDLYATVKDFEKSPNSLCTPPPARRPSEEPEPDYEAIHNLNREEEKVPLETNGHLVPKENDYESIGDLQHCRDITRL